MENLFEYYFLNIIVNVNFFSDLKFEYYCEYYYWNWWEVFLILV